MLDKIPEVMAVGETCALDLDVFKETKVLDLVLYSSGIERKSCFLVVTLDAANIVRLKQTNKQSVSQKKKKRKKKARKSDREKKPKRTVLLPSFFIK